MREIYKTIIRFVLAIVFVCCGFVLLSKDIFTTVGVLYLGVAANIVYDEVRN